LAVQLQDLLRALPAEIWEGVPPSDPLTVGGLSLDSRSVSPGDLFFALPGLREDGSRFVAEAWARGAVAVVVEGGAAAPDGPGPLLRARRAREALALAACLFHGEPSRALRLIGITGTDGKTSTCWFVQQLLAATGRQAVALGTLGVRTAAGERQPWGEAQPDAARAQEPARAWQPTTPEAPLFQATLAQLRAGGVQDVVAEISSHALAQARAYGSQFAAVALTQVSADHLDFHGSREEYLAAKARLFARATRGGPLEREPVSEVLNLDDALGRELAARRPGCVTYGRDEAARVRMHAGHAGAQGIELEVAFDGVRRTLRTSLIGAFHLQNLLTAAAVAHALGLTPDQIAAGAEALTPVPGRFEALVGGQPFTVIVDYAHTPDGLAGLLRAARALGPGRLTVVFGCGGDRDATKREPMGAAAGRLADRVIVTDDNPRSEDPEAIAAAVVRGVCTGTAVHELIHGRRRALARAVASAHRDEILVVAGRGAETLQVFADRVEAFDDREVLRGLLRSRSVQATLPHSDEDPWSLAAIARMTRATVAGLPPADWNLVARLPAAGVALDSRQLVGGEVFVALEGERVDGHAFAAPALEAGASAALVKRAWWSRRKAARAKGIHLLVDDPIEALQDWAAALRLALAPKVIAITGSSGKTSTKELTLALLRRHGEVIGTVGNRNNEIGLPWTLLQLRGGSAWAVVELGANHVGEIARLTRICRPDVAVITCIGRAHVGRFGGAEALLEAKLEILEGLDPQGALVIPDDDERLRARAAASWAGPIVRFGFTDEAEVAARVERTGLAGTELRVRGLAVPLRVRLLGVAGARAALAALASVRALGLPDPDLDALAAVAPFPGRLDPVEANGITWLLDMYNASPESVLHALDFLARVETPGRKVFVFGGMRELGESSGAIHGEIGRAAGACDAGVFFGEEGRIVGPEAQRAGVKQVVWCDQLTDAVRFLREYLVPGDVVLLKGARASALEKVAVGMGVIAPGYGEGRF
jgi:MurE/MurF fusion protein